MSDRNRRILAWVLALAAVLLLGYAAFTVALIVRGDLEVGPLRVLTMVANVITGALALWAAVAFARQPPRK